ncbi:hypothetical protein [Kitasatospora sp. GAS204B]|uniref:hypothetical protein n=1 Tax=unclassified Kitasatospora TaxID=2633591 RepID=UPI0024738037|nr:hypothetical protein [Kitasatospora sp. GAS204B]MDH6119855.1 hypothetical protein [Kitasatospora sp. GAS204B]
MDARLATPSARSPRRHAQPQGSPRVCAVVGSSATEEQLRAALAAVGERCEPLGGSWAMQLYVKGQQFTVHRLPRPVSAPRTLDVILPSLAQFDVVLLACEGDSSGSVGERWVIEAVRRAGAGFTDRELAGIDAAMPLLGRFAIPEPVMAGWALVFRDHYVENSVGFLAAMERVGVPAQWVYALSKGDRTRNRDQVHETFLRRGYRSDVLDNSFINATSTAAKQDHARQSAERVAEFIRQAHAVHRRVLVIDNGGLLALGHGPAGGARADAAIELTVSGLKRIKAAGAVEIPVVNLARSAVKTHLGYNEIADSCLRRLREVVSGEKFIGRRVAVVDPDILALIQAAEQGFETYRTMAQALSATRPLLIVGTAGEQVID